MNEEERELLDTPELRRWHELGGRTTTPSQVKAQENFKRTRRYQDIEDNRHFVQANDKGVKQIMSTLTLTQAGTLLGLMAYVNDEKGTLYFEGKKIGNNEVAKLLKVGKTTAKRNVGELVDLGYVLQKKEGRKIVYSVNSEIAHKGAKKGKGFFSKVYVVNLRKLVQWLTIQELGLLFFMIPYFNSRYYTLCKNPYEMDPEKIELLDRKGFAKEVGVSYERVKKLIPKLLKKQALVGIRTCRTAIVVTPKLLARNNRFVTIEEVTDIIDNELNKREKMEW